MVEEVLAPLEEVVAVAVSADTYTFNNTSYPIQIIRKNNKNTYIRVKNNTIIITTNHFTRNNQIIKLINDNKPFIEKMLNKNNLKSEDSTFKLFGNSYDIIYGFPDIEITQNKIYASNEKAFSKYLSQYLEKIYSERLNYYYKMFNESIPVPHLKIRKMTSRWGVCNINNHNVTLNSELSKYDLKCLDYVIVHELSHFVHPNHSKNFWLLVSKYCPNYKEIRKSLKN